MPCFFNAFGIVHTSAYGATFCDCGETRSEPVHEHGPHCRCASCRHDRFNPGPPSMTKRQRRERAHVEAIAEDHDRAAKAATTQED